MPRRALPLRARVARLALLAFLCGLPLAPHAAAAPAPPARARAIDAGEPAQVLVITGTDPYLPAFVAIDAAMRSALAQRHPRAVVWLYESLDSLRLAGATGPALAELLARKYEGVRIDALVLFSEPAVEFHLQHRDRLWPRVSTVYDWVAPEFARALPPDAGMVGIPAATDFAGTLRIALALQPGARRLVLVGGASRFDEGLLQAARTALAPVRERLQVEFLTGLSPQAAAARLAREDRDSIVLFTSLFRDAAGQIYVPRDALSTLVAASAAPVYGSFETYLGHGLAAGAMDSFASHGDRVGDLVARALDGRLAGLPIVQPPPPSSCLADGRQLRRFGLSARALPPGCDVRYVEPPFLQRYAWQTAAVALALGAQSALIAALLLQRRRRRAAEQSLQAQRAQLLHASRLAVAGELTAAIAHEINQPLTAILGNTEAAEMMVEAGRLSEEELLQILRDIRRDDLRASEVIKRLRTLLAGHEGERRRFSLNDCVGDTAALLNAEARRRGVTLEQGLEARRPEVLADAVQIQQVIINLCLNAFDASDTLPAPRRRVRLTTADTAEGVQLGVRDAGTGIPVADLPRVFDSFYSTKHGGMGLGLAIARSIVEAHGGTIRVTRHDEGVEFLVVLPHPPATAGAPPAAEPHAP
jgi:signal transduction histidine kinase